MEAKRGCKWWWFESHNTAKASHWLQSTLSELNEKTTSMLKLVEEDADSFAQRAEMYYKKRPQLIAMVEDFYRTHRSLAERHDQLKHHISSSAFTFVHTKPFDSCTDTSYASEESEVHDPEEDFMRFYVEESCDELVKKLRDELDRLSEENEFQRKLIEQKAKENEEIVMKLKLQSMILSEEVNRKVVEAKRQLHESKKVKEAFHRKLIEQKTKENEECVMKLQFHCMSIKEEVKRKDMEAKIQLHESEKMKKTMHYENGRLKEALAEKDEAKREVIRQLSSAMEMVKEENRVLRKYIVKGEGRKNRGGLEILKGLSLGKWFSLSPKR